MRKHRTVAWVIVIAVALVSTAAFLWVHLGQAGAIEQGQPAAQASTLTGSDVGPEGLLEGVFPEDLEAQDQVIHLRIVTNEIDINNTRSADLWLRSTNGDFLSIERKNSDVVSETACDGSRAQKYDVESHRAYDFTVAKLLSLEPEALTPQRDSLEVLKAWAAETVGQSSGAGEEAVLFGRAALAYSSIGQSEPGPNTKQLSTLDLVVDKSTGLPLRAVLRGPDGGVVSSTDYDYEIADVPEGGFSLVFPAGYYVQSDEDLDSPAAENLSVGELVRAAQHDLYWLGNIFEDRPLTSSTISASGVVTLKYGEHPSSPEKSPPSPLVSVHEYVPSQLDPDIWSNIEAQLTDPKPVQGESGTYTVYTAALNGMPMLEAVIGDVHVFIADVEDGDVGVMVRAADALVKAAD